MMVVIAMRPISRMVAVTIVSAVVIVPTIIALVTLIPARVRASSDYCSGSGYKEHEQYSNGSANLTPLTLQVTTILA